MRYGIGHSALWLAISWIALNTLIGCRSVEVVEVNVAYPLATVHVAAKFEVDEQESDAKVAEARAPEALTEKASRGVRLANKQLVATLIAK